MSPQPHPNSLTAYFVPEYEELERDKLPHLLPMWATTILGKLRNALSSKDRRLRVARIAGGNISLDPVFEKFYPRTVIVSMQLNLLKPLEQKHIFLTCMTMEWRKTPLERAFEIGRSGQCLFSDLVKLLKSEKFDPQYVQGKALKKQLADLIDEARNKRKIRHAGPRGVQSSVDSRE